MIFLAIFLFSFIQSSLIIFRIRGKVYEHRPNQTLEFYVYNVSVNFRTFNQIRIATNYSDYTLNMTCYDQREFSSFYRVYCNINLIDVYHGNYTLISYMHDGNLYYDYKNTFEVLSKDESTIDLLNVLANNTYEYKANQTLLLYFSNDHFNPGLLTMIELYNYTIGHQRVGIYCYPKFFWDYRLECSTDLSMTRAGTYQIRKIIYNNELLDVSRYISIYIKRIEDDLDLLYYEGTPYNESKIILKMHFNLPIDGYALRFTLKEKYSYDYYTFEHYMSYEYNSQVFNYTFDFSRIRPGNYILNFIYKNQQPEHTCKFDFVIYDRKKKLNFGLKNIFHNFNYVGMFQVGYLSFYGNISSDVIYINRISLCRDDSYIKYPLFVNNCTNAYNNKIEDSYEYRCYFSPEDTPQGMYRACEFYISSQVYPIYRNISVYLN